MKKQQQFHKVFRKNTILMLAIASLIACAEEPQITQDNSTTVPEEVEPPKPKRKIKLGLLLDTSNSMDGLIDQAKSQLWKIVNKIADAIYEGEKPIVEIALYEYGNDRLNILDGYIRQVSPFTEDLDQISEELFALTTNGGSEYCARVIQTSMTELEWSSDSNDLQMIFIAGNEPFDQQDSRLSYKSACINAIQNGVSINTIFCGPAQQGIFTKWKKGADIGKGNYMNIDQDQKTVYIPSPYDDRINQLNSNLNNTYIYYGKQGYSKKQNQINQDANASRFGQGNSVTRIISKSKHMYKNKKWDLVDASKDKSFDVSKIDSTTLPKEMQSMNTDERKQYIHQKEKERSAVKKEILELNKKREAFIEKEKLKHADDKSLDNSIISSIQKKAAEKNFSFEK